MTRPRCDRWLAIGLLAGLVMGLALTFGIAARTGDASTLVHFAPPFTDEAQVPDGIVVLPERRGYDGQFYWRLATDPLSDAERVEGVAFDHPALRTTRIGYPATANALSRASFGVLDVVNSMLLVNVAALTAIGGAGVAIARRAGRHPLAGVVFVTVPALVYGTSMSVTDTLAAACVVGAIASVQRDRLAAAGVLLSAAALTRETALLLPVTALVLLAGAALAGRPVARHRDRVLAASAPVIVALSWQAVVVLQWGEFGPLSAGGKNLTIPFLGPFQTDGLLTPSGGDGWLNLLAPSAVAVVLALGVIGLLRHEFDAAPPYVSVGFGVAVFIAVSIGPALLETYRNSVRGLGDASMLVVVLAMYGTGKCSRAILVGTALIGLGLAAWELRIAPDLS